jgi:hypothetical protein
MKQTVLLLCLSLCVLLAAAAAATGRGTTLDESSIAYTSHSASFQASTATSTHREVSITSTVLSHRMRCMFMAKCSNLIRCVQI